MKNTLSERVKAIFHQFNINAKEHGINLGEVQLEAEAKLQDGTSIYTSATEMAVGVDVYTKDADGNPVPATAGEYILEDGTKVMVGDNGLVAEMVKVETETEEMSAEALLSAINNLSQQLAAYKVRETELMQQLTKTEQARTNTSQELNTVKAELAALRNVPAADSVKAVKHDMARKTPATPAPTKPFALMSYRERVIANLNNIKNN